MATASVKTSWNACLAWPVVLGVVMGVFSASPGMLLGQTSETKSSVSDRQRTNPFTRSKKVAKPKRGSKSLKTAKRVKRGAKSAKNKSKNKKKGRKVHPLERALKLARASRASLDKHASYRASFHKKERVGRKLIEHTMTIKNRREPFSVYLKFHAPHAGREVIYVEGENDGNLLAHETGIIGLVGAISLSPTSPRAMSESAFPITSIGLWNLLDGVIEQWSAETKYGETKVTYYRSAKLGKRKCLVIESSHPRPRRQFKYHKTRLFIDKETNLPLRVEQYGFPPRRGASAPLAAEYTYSNINTDVKLDDVDFDTDNRNYNF